MKILDQNLINKFISSYYEAKTYFRPVDGIQTDLYEYIKNEPILFTFGHPNINYGIIFTGSIVNASAIKWSPLWAITYEQDNKIKVRHSNHLQISSITVPTTEEIFLWKLKYG